MSCSRFVVTLVVLSLLVGIGGMICGAYASYWYTASFTSTSDVNTGLWKMCKNIKGNKDCTTREAIFKFTTDHKFMFQVTTQTYDVVLVLVVGAGGFGCIAVLLALCLCCIRGTTTWKVVSSFAGVLALFAVAASAGAVAYADIFIRREMPPSEKNLYVHGWSSILAWTGGGAFILAFVMSIVLCFVLPGKPYSERNYGYDDTREEGFRYKANPGSAYNTINGNHTTSRSTANRNNFSTYENAGYEMR